MTFVHPLSVAGIILLSAAGPLRAQQNPLPPEKQAIEERVARERAEGAQSPAPRNPNVPVLAVPETPWQEQLKRCINAGASSVLSSLSSKVDHYDPSKRKPFQGKGVLVDSSHLCIMLPEHIYPHAMRTFHNEAHVHLGDDPHPEACLADWNREEECTGGRFIAMGVGQITYLAKSINPNVPDIEYKLNVTKASIDERSRSEKQNNQLAIDASDRSTMTLKLPIYSQGLKGPLIHGAEKNFPEEKPGQHSCGAIDCEDRIQLRNGKPYITTAQMGSGNSSWDDKYCEINLRYARNRLGDQRDENFSLTLKKISGSTHVNPSGAYIDVFRADLVASDEKKVGELLCNTGLKGEDQYQFTTTFGDLQKMLESERVKLHLISNALPGT